jgi:hypothetical protein
MRTLVLSTLPALCIAFKAHFPLAVDRTVYSASPLALNTRCDAF